MQHFSVPISFSTMTIAVMFLCQLADITSSVWQIHERNDKLALIPILSNLAQQSYCIVLRSTYIEGLYCSSPKSCLTFLSMHSNRCLQARTCMSEDVSVSLLLCLGFHNARVQDVPTN